MKSHTKYIRILYIISKAIHFTTINENNGIQEMFCRRSSRLRIVPCTPAVEWGADKEACLRAEEK